MTLITVIISLLAERYLDWIANLRPVAWFSGYTRYLRALFSKHQWMDGSSGVLIIVMPIIFITAMVNYLLNDVHGLLSFLFSLLVLVYCIGPAKLHEEMEKYVIAMENGDTEGALWKLDNIMGSEFPDNEPELFLLLAKSILVETCKRILGVLFWFAVLGPLGAVLYRLSCLLKDNVLKEKSASEFANAALRLQHIMNWLPARLTALSYALAGSFVHAVDCWRQSEPHLQDNRKSMGENEEVIACIGLSALQLADANKENSNVKLTLSDITDTLNLGMRSVIVWVTFIAIMTLAGWLG